MYYEKMIFGLFRRIAGEEQSNIEEIIFKAFKYSTRNIINSRDLQKSCTHKNIFLKFEILF